MNQESCMQNLEIRKFGRKKRNGFTLIEIAVVILIIATMVTAFLMRTHGAINEGNVAAVKQQATELEQVAHNYAANIGQPNYSGLSAFISGAVGTPGLLPQGYTASGIPNAFNGVGTLASSGSANQFTITETSLPADGCAQLATFFSSHMNNGLGTATCSGGTLTITTQ